MPIPDQLTLSGRWFVYDPADAGETGHVAREIGSRPGAIFVALAPGESQPVGALGLAILERLGKDIDRERQISGNDAWRLARVWMNAEEIQVLIVVGADRLDPRTWTDLADVGHQIPPPAVVLIQHQTGHDRVQRQLLRSEKRFKNLTPPKFHEWAERCLAIYSGREPTLQSRIRPRAFPSVPHVDVPFFRSACRDVLSREDFEVVDEAFRAAHDHASEWLAPRHKVTEDAAGAFLAGELRWARDVNEQLARLRGAQVAFLRRWWLLKVDLEALAAAHGVEPIADIDEDASERLLAYAHPKVSALAALAVASNLPPGRLSMLNADQIYTTGAFEVPFLWEGYEQLNLGDRTIPLTGARLFLRAHHLDRDLTGQPSNGPLFTTSEGDRLSAVGVRQWLRRVSHDTGLRFISGWSPPIQRRHAFWMHRRGLTLQAL
jgi:hypothetical protein